MAVACAVYLNLKMKTRMKWLIQKWRVSYSTVQQDNARITVSLPASVNGLGDSDSLEFWIQDINGQGRKYLDQQFTTLQAQAKQFQSFENLDKKSNPDKSKLKVDVRKLLFRDCSM